MTPYYTLQILYGAERSKKKFKSSQHPLYTFTVFNQERRRTDVTLTFLLI